MRKLIYFTIVGIGAFVGFISAIHDSWWLRFVMMVMGVVFALPLGGLAFVGKQHSRGSHPRRHHHKSILTGNDVTPDDLAANYWRDKGHPPFMNPADAIPDSNITHPDKVG
jgi:hypothetical protein